MASKYADLDDQERVEKAQEFSEIIKRMESEIQNGYIGQEDVIRKILLAVVAGGNVLLEGVPGLGKSLLVELLGRTVEGTSFNRVQFTPDLLPADIIGVEAYNEDRGFYIEKGPIFANFILADEINRAPPKVQSAMLEAMQEHKVSIGDETFHLDEPFFVMATQNPTEQGGSLPLDETLYMDGKLWNAGDALEHAREHGTVVHEDDGMKLHRLPDSTGQTLSTSGEMYETPVMVYEKEYNGDMHTLETETGREITATHNHPFLVMQDGDIRWKHAEELEEGDRLVTPEELDIDTIELPEHKEVRDKYDIGSSEHKAGEKAAKVLLTPVNGNEVEGYLKERFGEQFEDLIHAPEEFVEGFVDGLDETETHDTADRNVLNSICFMLLNNGHTPDLSEDALTIKPSKSASQLVTVTSKSSKTRTKQYQNALMKSDVFFDSITSIKTSSYEGTVTGLAVPGSHNYVAGMGACGINHNTYPLPEAQIDRFLFKIYLDYPKKKNERKIIDMNANIMDDEDFGVNTAVQKQDIINVQEFTKVVKVTEDVKAYIVDLVDATRNPGDYGLEYSEYIDWGGTPRASINTALAARAHAIYHGRDYVTPEDIRAVLRDVFIHRIILNYEGQAQGIEVDDVIDDIKDNVPVV